MKFEDLTEEQINNIKSFYDNNSYDETKKYIVSIFNVTYIGAGLILKAIRQTYSKTKHQQPRVWNEERLNILNNSIKEYGVEEGLEKASSTLNIPKSACKRKMRELGYHSDEIVLLEGEEFKQYKDSNYYISNKGRIYSVNKCRKRLIKPQANTNGYLAIGLCSYDGKKHLMHKLVAELFIPNPENKPYIDHIDTNRHNNCVDNLKWVTSEENMANELTRLHCSIGSGGSSIPFTIIIINEETGEITNVNSMAQLYKFFNLEYIPKYVGIQHFKNHTIMMRGEDNDDYLIGKMLRRGNSKEELIEKITNYSESKEYKKYLNQKGTP